MGKSWQWILRGNLKGCTEALICSAQEQALRTNYITFHIDKDAESLLCRMCGERGETISHLVSECGKLPQKEYKRRYDNVARYVHWQLCREKFLSEQINGMNRSRKQLLRMRTLSFYGASPFSATERLRQGDQILFW